MMSMIWWCQATRYAQAYGRMGRRDRCACAGRSSKCGGTVDAKGGSWRALFIAKVPSVLLRTAATNSMLGIPRSPSMRMARAKPFVGTPLDRGRHERSWLRSSELDLRRLIPRRMSACPCAIAGIAGDNEGGIWVILSMVA